jgi:outer membrane protein OmpA-like peptidoglycan-associated protein/V8-like Glu-specific endopeptidase
MLRDPRELEQESEEEQPLGHAPEKETGPNPLAELESEEEWEQSPDCSGPARETVSGFSRYSNSVAALPPSEQAKLRNIASLIVRSFRPACRAIRIVRLVGHADRDWQRGPAFENRISVQRAGAVQQALQQLINNRTVSSRIAWRPSGVGASRLVVLNPTSEKQRAINRRVEVYLSTKNSDESYPILVRHPRLGYLWTAKDALVRRQRAAEAEFIVFPEPTPVTNSLLVPFKWICSIEVDFGPEVLPGPIVTGNRIGAKGTGTLISPRHVLTAGHCLLTRGPNTKDVFGNLTTSTRKALSVMVVPGRNGGKLRPVQPKGRITVTSRLRVSQQWESSNATDRAFDFGLITLDAPLSSDYGFWTMGNTRILALHTAMLQGKVAHTSGYPGAFCPPPDPSATVPCTDATRGTVQFQMSGTVTSVSAETIESEMKIAGGHSGSPMWLLTSGDSPTLVGIASASSPQAPDIAVRIREALLAQVRKWMMQDGVRPSF